TEFASRCPTPETEPSKLMCACLGKCRTYSSITRSNMGALTHPFCSDSPRAAGQSRGSITATEYLTPNWATSFAHSIEVPLPLQPEFLASGSDLPSASGLPYA